MGCVVDKEWTRRSLILLPFSTSTKTYLDRWPKHVNASLPKASACMLLPLGIFLTEKLLSDLLICWTAFTNFSILLSFASNSPVIWLTTSLDLVRAVTFSAYMFTTSLKPASKASYSALFLDVWKLKRRAYVTSSPVVLVRMRSTQILLCCMRSKHARLPRVVVPHVCSLPFSFTFILVFLLKNMLAHALWFSFEGGS